MFLVPHSPEEYAALEADIKTRRQVLIPVVKDQHGNMIDGFARAVIAEKLGLKNVPEQIMSVKDEEERRHLAYHLNANRRQLTVTQKRGLIEAELKRNPGIHSRRLARIIGTSPQTVCNIRRRLGVQNGQDADQGEEKKASVFAVNGYQAEEGRKVLATLGDTLPHAMTSKQAGYQARKQRIAECRSKAVPVKEAASVGIHHCDFRNLDVANGAVNLCIADHPYDAASLPLYGALARCAVKKLAEDGIVVAYKVEDGCLIARRKQTPRSISVAARFQPCRSPRGRSLRANFSRLPRFFTGESFNFVSAQPATRRNQVATKKKHTMSKVKSPIRGGNKRQIEFDFHIINNELPAMTNSGQAR